MSNLSYSDINPSLTYNTSLPNNNIYDFTYYKEDPKFKNTQIHNNSEYYCGGNSSLALRGIQVENSPVSLKYFSDENMNRIQSYIKYYVKKISKGKYILEVEQDKSDLLVAMRAVFLEHSKYLPYDIDSQVKELNKKTLKYILPDIITNITQQIGYIKDITQPITPIDRPINVNRAGRKTLPSTTSVWGF